MTEAAKHAPGPWGMSNIQVLIVSIVAAASYAFGFWVGWIRFDNEYEYQDSAIKRGYAEWVIEDPREKPDFRWKDSE